MAEYIRKDIARRVIDSPRNREQMLAMLDAVPSEDVQPVIRCKDCKHSYVFEPWEGINAVRYCKTFKNYYGDSDFCVNDDGYCSYGVRESGERVE